MKVQFIGDGGHAGNLKHGLNVVENSEHKVLAFGGMDCEKLERRVTQRPYGNYPCIVNRESYYHLWRGDGEGIQIMMGAIIQNNVTLGDFCIINTGAIIEHDAVIGNGCHIAPGAVILGNANVGAFSFVGANAVVVQGCIVPPRTFIKAGSVWNKK